MVSDKQVHAYEIIGLISIYFKASEGKEEIQQKSDEPQQEQNISAEQPAIMPVGPLKICVCGSGESAHCMVGLAASQADVKVRVLALHENDAELWSKEMESNDFAVVINEKNGTTREVKAKPEVITKEPEEAITGSDFILMAMSPISHETYLKAIEPYIGKNTLIVGLPGSPGFEFQCRDILAEKSIPCTLMNFDNLPWDSKIIEFGKKVEILNFRTYLTGSMIRGRGICKRPPLMTLQMLHGSEPIFRQSKHYLESVLMSHSYLKPAIIFGHWNRWNGKPVPQTPLFYESMTKETADLISHCSDECVTIAQALMKNSSTKVDLSDVKNIFEWYKEFCTNDVEDCSDLFKAISTNKLYKGVSHQMKKVTGGLVPDYHCEFLEEDIPMGMVVIRALADFAGVKIINIDMLLEWCQKKMGKEYLVNGELKGKDMQSTRCPQRFGFTTLESVISCQKDTPS